MERKKERKKGRKNSNLTTAGSGETSLHGPCVAREVRNNLSRRHIPHPHGSVHAFGQTEQLYEKEKKKQEK
jgi:hypothetical protein